MNISKNNIYFNAEGFVLLEGDCFKLLKKIDPESIDMIFADPPYFLSSGGISCKNGKQVVVDKGTWDVTKTIEEKIKYHRTWIGLCRNVLTNNGTIWISATLHSIYAIGVALEMEGFSIINNIIWQKPNPAPNLACRCFTHSTETIIWARKQITMKKKGNHYFDYVTMKDENGGKQMKDVWVFDEEVEIWNIPTAPKKEKLEGYHPTQKPLKLLERIIKASTKENDLVLDPFNGSGTTGIACKNLKRKYIGIDIDKSFLELTKKRYEVQ
ncbi:MAG: site-specific DNA-methyltransferase [Bacilli bacterium]|nr:site-specific DNA-methyltransferase [Mollicutes bacterium]MDY3898801.1 site-specific DNA-methyltransferase [Bacilli bacterium]